MSDLLTTLHPINDVNTDLYPNVKNENIPSVISGKDAMEALEGSFDTLRTDEMQIGGDNGTIINSTQIATPNKVINLDEIVDDDELAQGLSGKVDKVQGKGLSTNDFTNADKLALETTIPNALDGKVDKVQGKGLSTNDFTDAYKQDLDTDIPEQFQLIKDNVEGLGHALINKVDKVSGKGLSTNDYTNADKALVDTIPDKVDKVQGKGLSTNDFTNADKAYLDNLPTYFISIASGGVVDLANPPASSSTSYFGAKNGTTSLFRLSDSQVQAKVTGNTGGVWSFLMNGNGNSVPMFTHIIPASGVYPAEIRQYKLPNDLSAGVYTFLVSTAQRFQHEVSQDNSVCTIYQDPTSFGFTFDAEGDVYMGAEIVNNAEGDSDLQDDYNIPLFLNLDIEIENNPNVESAMINAVAINAGGSYFTYLIMDFHIVLTSNNINSLDLNITFNKDILKYYNLTNNAIGYTSIGDVLFDGLADNEMALEWTRRQGVQGTDIDGTIILNVRER